MSITHLFVLSSAAVFLASPVLAATAVSASMSVQADVQLNGATLTDLSTDAWGPLLSPMSIGAQKTNADAAGNSVSAAGYGNASWGSADVGGVSFEAYSWDIQSSIKVGANLNNATPDWSYTFMAGAGDGGFKMAYNVNGYGATFGLWGWSIAVTGGPEGVQQLLVSNAFDPTTAGVFNASLTAGSQYTATLSNNANVSCDGGCTFVGGMNGNFRWEVTPVPEPQTYALMALGLGLMGWVARRRRRAER